MVCHIIGHVTDILSHHFGHVTDILFLKNLIIMLYQAFNAYNKSQQMT